MKKEYNFKQLIRPKIELRHKKAELEKEETNIKKLKNINQRINSCKNTIKKYLENFYKENWQAWAF